MFRAKCGATFEVSPGSHLFSRVADVPSLWRSHMLDINLGTFVPQVGDGRTNLLGEVMS
jgi:uncharacterized protein YdiU (UPF0061 family)